MGARISSWSKINNAIFVLLLILFRIENRLFPWLTAVGLLSFIMLWALHWKLLGRFKPFAGYANRLTLMRLLLVVLLGWFHPAMSPILIFSLALLNVLLDGLDGYLARRYDQKSQFGQAFDMETDAFYVAIMTGILYLQGSFGFWLVVIGFLRYGYGLLLTLFNLYEREIPRTRIRAVIAGIFFLALLSPFVLPENLYTPIITAASILIGLSFFFSLLRVLKSHGKDR